MLINVRRLVREPHLRLSIALVGCLALLVPVLLFSVVPAAAKRQPSKSQQDQKDARTLRSESVRVTGRAIVNMSQLSKQESGKTSSSSDRIGRVIHSPVSPPEDDAPAVERSESAATVTVEPLVPSPPPQTNFIAHSDVPQVGTGFVVIPPDTNGAVGLTRIFVNLNNNYVIQDKATGAVIGSPVSMDTFWASTGATGTFDPRTEYDPYNNRWLVSAVSDSASANSSILIGVSETDDPAGNFFTFRVDYDGGNGAWADFPVMGFNKNWVAIGLNSVDLPGPPVANKTLVVDYPTLRTGSLTATLFTGTGVCASPAVTYSTTENTLYVIVHVSSAGATYHMDTITGTPAAPVYTVTANKVRPGGGWTLPSGQILPQAGPLAGTITACGAGVPCPLEPQDAFIRSNPVFRNNNIYYVQTVGLPAGGLTRTAVQWTRLDASGNFVEGGRIDDPTATSSNGGNWYAYGSIAVNKFDEILIGFSQFASDQHVAAGYAFRGRIPGAPMKDPIVYKAGEDYYHKTFGGSRNRWGDYSSTQVDPSDDTAMWTLQEYAMLRAGTDDGNTGSNSSRWSTWWAKLALSPTAAAATIGGVVEDNNGVPLGGVTIALSGAVNRTTITDANGNYRFENVDTENFYTVTPSLMNYRFTPVERSFSLNGNRTDAVFTATPETMAGANAIDSNEFFVRQQYLDFLGREPDQRGFDYWNAQLRECGVDRACLTARRTGVSAAFFVEEEFQRTGSFIYRLYKGALGRQLSYAEFSSDRTQVVEGPGLDASKTAFANAFVTRLEFINRYQNATDAASFVDLLLATISTSGGADLTNERSMLIAKYNTGGNLNESRALVVREIADNGVFAQVVYNRVFVLMEYFGYLQRDPDADGYAFWLNILDNREPGNYRGMVCSFITSAEYQRRFSSAITRSNVDCR